MNVVRYYLSFCVLIAHTAVLTGVDLPWIQRGTVDVGCFFAISGFLMFPSFQKRPTLHHYIRRRALRILPPYFFIVLLCAFVLLSVSTLSWRDYFCDSGFWKYLLANMSFLNFLHPDLPGVFEGSQFYTSAVNGSLWTMKGEWVCYLSVPPVFWLVSRFRKRCGLLLGIIAVGAMAMRYFFLMKAESTGLSVYDIISRQFGTLLVFFYIGAFINYYFHLFLRYKWYILAADVICILFYDKIPFYYDLLQPLVAGSLILWVSMIGRWGAFLSRHDSVSYDIYLFHFPIIQLAVYFGLPEKMNPQLMLCVIVAVTVGLAFASWNLIGRRFARYGKKCSLKAAKC